MRGFGPPEFSRLMHKRWVRVEDPAQHVPGATEFWVWIDPSKTSEKTTYSLMMDPEGTFYVDETDSTGDLAMRWKIEE